MAPRSVHMQRSALPLSPSRQNDDVTFVSRRINVTILISDVMKNAFVVALWNILAKRRQQRGVGAQIQVTKSCHG